MSDKPKKARRVPSNTSRAKPKERVSYKEILREVEARTGFRYSDIRTVYLCILDVIFENLIAKKLVRIPKLGMIYASIKRSRPVTNMRTGEKMIMPSRWVCRFQPGPTISEQLLDVVVTQEEEDKMYSYLKKRNE